jgi:hypothetical protein
MAVSHVIVHCGNCGTILDKNPNTTIVNQHTCIECGSQKRSARIDVESGMNSKFIIKAREGKRKKGKPVLEQIVGDQFDHKTNRWIKKKRVIDVSNDWYVEIIQNPETGEITHRCEEPLSKHRGHGSAKKKN